MYAYDISPGLIFFLAFAALLVISFFGRQLLGFLRNLFGVDQYSAAARRRGSAGTYPADSYASTHDTYASSPSTASETFAADASAPGGSWDSSGGSDGSSSGGDYSGGDSGGGGDFGGGGSGGGWS